MRKSSKSQLKPISVRQELIDGFNKSMLDWDDNLRETLEHNKHPFPSGCGCPGFCWMHTTIC